MPKPGSVRSRPRPSAKALLAGAALPLVCAGSLGKGDLLRPYTIVGDAIPASLTGKSGDPVRGRPIVVDRRLGACLLCHTGPFPEETFQGTLAPDLSGSGSRWSAGQLRLRLVDASRLNPDTIMPPYYRVDGLSRVGKSWAGQPILTAEQIEDVVAFLETLRGAE
ncbi:MAG: sulfur oxidation c-type cytochrome SoxX [Stellaceae bacterium]